MAQLPTEIGSSDAPIILGVSPFCTPWQLWAERVGLLPKRDTVTEAMRFGTVLEDVVATYFIREVLGNRVADVFQKSPHTTLHRWTWCRATPDVYLLVDDEPAIIEVKNLSDRPGRVPRVDHVVQCVHQRIVYNHARRQFLVSFGGLHMEWWEVPAHQAALDRVLREEERFLERIEKQNPPPVRAADASVLAKAWPITTPEPVALDVAASEWAQTLSDARKWETHWKKTGELAEAKLKQAMAAHEKGTLPDGGVVKWKPYQREAYIVPQTTIRPLLVTLGKEEGS